LWQVRHGLSLPLNPKSLPCPVLAGRGQGACRRGLP
jgi:hypothetical protein